MLNLPDSGLRDAWRARDDHTPWAGNVLCHDKLWFILQTAAKGRVS
jgi:hypothetical protein